MIYVALMLLLMLYPAQLAMIMTKWSKRPIKVKKIVKGPGGKKIPKVVMRRPNPTMSERIKCCLPYGSAIMVWKSMCGSCGWTAIISILSMVAILFRIVVVFLTTAESLWIVSFWAFWIGILLFHLLYAITYTYTAYMYTLGLVVVIATFIFPYGLAWHMCTHVPRVMNAMEEEDNDIFKG